MSKQEIEEAITRLTENATSVARARDIIDLVSTNPDVNGDDIKVAFDLDPAIVAKVRDDILPSIPPDLPGERGMEWAAEQLAPMIGESLHEQSPLVDVRLMSITDVQADANILDLPVVKSGTLADVNAWARAQGLQWRRDTSIYGGYYVDQATGDSYLLT